jgi:hypothetical protein
LLATMVEPVFWPRLRWRMRGAWQWPAFAALTLADAVLVSLAPFAGDGPNAIGALLLALFFNLLAVAVGAPLLGMLLRRRRPDLPRLIARDYAGTALLGLVTAAFAVGGVLHHAGLREERADRLAAVAAVHAYIVSQAPRYRGGNEDMVLLEPDHYRACVYGPSRLPLCLFVRTDQSPAGITVDPSRVPNER